MKALALALALLCASVLAATARADAPPSLFDGAGVFVDNPATFPARGGLVTELEANHFTWIAFHVNNGLAQHDIPLDWLDVFREHGIAVGGWGYEDGKPLIEAVLADLAVRSYGLDFYIADAEAPYEQTKKLHGWTRSKTFVDEFRSLEPTLPAALTTLRRRDGARGCCRSTSRPGVTPASTCCRRRTTTSSRRRTGPT